MPLNLDAYLGVHAAALKVRGQRTELLAKNLANADTPGYKAQDIDFRAALARSGKAAEAARATQISSAARALARWQHRRRAARAGRLRRERGALPGDALLSHRPLPRPDDRHHRPVTSEANKAMSSFKVFDIAGSGLSAQSVRLNTVASNLANADSVSGDPEQGLQGAPPGVRSRARLDGAAARVRRAMRPCACAASWRTRPNPARATSRATRSRTPKAMCTAPNVNVVEEMVDMISASRAYQNNVEVLNTSKELMLATLRLGQS